MCDVSNLLLAHPLNKTRKVTDWDSEWEIKNREHFSQEEPPHCHRSHEQCCASSLDDYQRGTTEILIWQLTYCSSPASSMFPAVPNAMLKCWPVRSPKARTKLEKHITCVISVLNEQTRKIRLSSPMKSVKNPNVLLVISNRLLF